MIEPLLATWRGEVGLLRGRGQEHLAAFLESVIRDAEEFLYEHDDKLLTLTEGALESGFSADHLGRLVREGKIANSGRPNAPRIARRDLPRKSVAQAPVAGDISRTRIVRSAISQE